MKLLLTSVFKPFGVDDEYGKKENKMELFHNQVTREQGIFSYRFNHGSHGLNFLAENVDIPTTILDFPSFKRFKKELKKKYDYVGISFIVPNFKKAKKMAQAIRELSPASKIILGGHGVNIPDIESMIDHDFICKGEGVYFLRKLFGETMNKPIKHPLAYSSFNRKVMGAPLPSRSGILITGLGCVNKCRFCSTSHFFGDYIPYLKTGRDIFDVCCRYEDEKNITDFGVLDENFLKMKGRALELLDLMEKNHRQFNFSIFSSAETLTAIGDLDIFVRLGVNFIWIGVESKKEIFAKNKNINFYTLMRELKKRGISILVSSILFLENHDKVTIWEDIDYATSLNPDYLQFMQLGPMPGTKLYTDYEQSGKLIPGLPYESKHGQGKIWFQHDHFTREESEELLRLAFEIDYNRNGASMLRAVKTTMQGYLYCANHPDERIRRQSKNFKSRLKFMRCLLMASTIFVQNRQSETLLKEIKKAYRSEFGRMNLPTLFLSLFVVFFGIKEYLQRHICGDARAPKTSYRSNIKVDQHGKQWAKQTGAAQTLGEMIYPLSQTVDGSFNFNPRRAGHHGRQTS